MALTYQQTKLVKDTIPVLREHGERISTIFYRTMLTEHPELNDYFNGVNLKNGRQPRALTAIILNFAANINNISELIPKFERMCNKHCSLGIKPEHYEVVGKYLLQAFGEVLGDRMTTDVLAAWTKAYWVLAKMLIGREAQLYKDFEAWASWRPFKIDRVVQETDDVYSFYLVPKDGRRLPKFQPGQYVSVQIQVPGGHLQSRQYSLSDASRDDHYRISVKRDEGSQYANTVSKSYQNPGIVSNILINYLTVGSVLNVSHPAGEFFLDTNNDSNVPLVLISAGIGITPMISITNTVLATQPGRQVSFIHGSRKTIPFEEHIAQLRRKNPNFHSKIFKSHPSAGDRPGASYDYDCRIDLTKLAETDMYLHNGAAEYYLCGPEGFMVDASHFLFSRGVSKNRVKLELFTTGELAAKQG